MKITVLPPDIIRHVCRLGEASSWAALSAVCRGWRNALKALPDNAWKCWALARFRRLSKLEARLPSGPLWKEVYQIQMAAEHVPEPPAPDETRAPKLIQGYAFTIEIVRGPDAAALPGKVELEWMGSYEEDHLGVDTDQVPRPLDLWEAGQEPDAVIFVLEGDDGDRSQDTAEQRRRLKSLDLRFSLWVTDCGTEMGKTVRLVEDAALDHESEAENDLLPDIAWDDSALPEVLHAPLDLRHYAICGEEAGEAAEAGEEARLPLLRFACRPWLDVETGELTCLIRGDIYEDYRDMTIRQIVLYLEHFVPW